MTENVTSQALATTEGMTSEELALVDELYADVLKENLDGIIPRRPVISLKGGFFIMPPDEDNSDEWTTKKLTGNIVRKMAVRSYYAYRENKDEVVPPDCASENCHLPNAGENQQAKECEGCPMNEFGSAIDDNGNADSGKACREKRRLFIQRGNQVLPSVLHIPQTSIKGFDGYITNLHISKIPFPAANTLMVSEVKSKGKLQWTTVKFEREGLVDKARFLELVKIKKSLDPKVDVPF